MPRGTGERKPFEVSFFAFWIGSFFAAPEMMGYAPIIGGAESRAAAREIQPNAKKHLFTNDTRAEEGGRIIQNADFAKAELPRRGLGKIRIL